MHAHYNAAINLYEIDEFAVVRQQYMSEILLYPLIAFRVPIFITPLIRNTVAAFVPS